MFNKKNIVGSIPASDERKKKINKTVLKKHLFVYSILAYFLILFSVFYVYVNINSILLAFKSYNIDGSTVWVGFKNFQGFVDKIIMDGGIVGISLINSVKLFAISLVVSLPLYIIFSYLVFKKCFAHNVIRFVAMLPSILSGFIICLMFKQFVENGIRNFLVNVLNMSNPPSFFEDEGWAFGVCCFFNIWVSFATNLIVYPNAMKEIDESILEAASVDGVHNSFQELFYIILPLIFPTISTFLITGFAGILMVDGSLVTLYYENAPIHVYNMGYYYWKFVKGATTFTNFPELAAGGLIMTVIIAPLTMLIRKILEKVDPTAN